MRGFASIGLVRPKHQVNIGSVIRAAYCYRAALLAIENPRAQVKQRTDTQKAWRNLPILRGSDLHDLIPYGAVPIAVDLVEDAEDLFSFEHPERAFYIFGPEDGTLGKKHLSWCSKRIMIPTAGCLNLAACVNVVLYDRAYKASQAKLQMHGRAA